MKHFKIIGVSLFIVGVFSVYYAQAISEVRSYPSFVLETKEGEPEIVENTTIYGNYSLAGVYHPFSHALNQTKYMEQASYLEGLNGFGQPAEIKRLEHDYPSYMRGKDGSLEMYTESDLYIVQAAIKWGTYRQSASIGDAFELAVLHKELKKQVRFTIPIPEADQDSFRMLETTYAVGERLHLITSHELDSSDGETHVELRIYTVQLDRGKISRMDVVHTWELDDSHQESDVIPIKNHHSIVSDQRMVLLKRVVHDSVDLEDVLQIDEQVAGNIHYELIAYDFRTKGFETYPLPTEIADGAKIISYEDNSTLYVTQIVDSELHILEWTLGEEEHLESTVVPLERTPRDYVAEMIDHHIYIYVDAHGRDQRVGELHVLHIPTGEWLYKGELMMDRPLRTAEEVELERIE